MDKHSEDEHMYRNFYDKLFNAQTEIKESFETFKADINSKLNTIIDGQNILKQELSMFKDKCDPRRLKSVEDSITKLASVIGDQQISLDRSKLPVVQKSENVNNNVEKRRKKMCFIGDSVAKVLDRKVIEKATGLEVKRVTAHTAFNNNSLKQSNEKSASTNSSLHEILKAETSHEVDVLVVQAPSDDITSLDTTEDKARTNEEYLKQQTIIAATNVISEVSNTLKSNPSIKKAIIMECTPRYDTISEDPLSAKAGLISLYNDTLEQSLLSSSLKDRILLGSHNLECSGGVRSARFGWKNRFDGIHLRGVSGQKAYTESLLITLKKAQMVKASPESYFHRYHKSVENFNTVSQNPPSVSYSDITRSNGLEYTVSTSNRFSQLNY